MPIPTIPGIIPMPFAHEGQKNVIQESNDSTSNPSATWSAGFPPITMINKQAGGKPPYGLDFNGLFNALSQHLFFQQSGGVYPWNAGLNYLAGAHVVYTDGIEYIALAASGPETLISTGGYVGAKTPADNPDYWIKFFNRTPANGQPYDLPIMIGATASADGVEGLVPAPAAGAQSAFLRGDGMWQTVDVYKGATANTVGVQGLVPAASAGAQSAFLRADGTWTTIQTNVTAVAGAPSSPPTLPAGGTWAYICVTAPNGDYVVRATAGIAAGGTVIGISWNGSNYPYLAVKIA